MAKNKYNEGASLSEKKSFSKYLADDEEIILVTGLGKTYLRHRFIFYTMIPGVIFILLGLGWSYLFKQNLGMGLLIGLILATIVAFIKTLWLHKSHRYILTTRRVLIKEGFFAVKLTSALFDKITHIEVDQSFMDRVVMHHGTIIINTAGMNKGEIKLEYIDAPIEFKNLLERLINREREQLGRQSGPVVTLEGELVD